MTYRGKKIKGLPTKAMIDDFLRWHQGYIVYSFEVMEYWGAKHWKTKRGTEVQALETAINVSNSIKWEHLRKEQREWLRNPYNPFKNDVLL